jgi:uncharacterized protein (TIRG00374 family)
LLLTALFLTIGPEQILETFRRVHPVEGVMAGICLFFLFLCGAVNVWFLLSAMGKVSLPTFLNVYAHSWALGLIMPGQAGDASMILLSRKYGIPLRQTGIAYFFDKFITIAVFVCVAWFGSYVLLDVFRGLWPFILSLIVVLMVGGILVIRFLPAFQGPGTRIQNWVAQIREEITVFKKKWYILFLNTMVTIFKWLVLSLAYFLAFLSFDVRVPWPEIAVIPILSTLVGYIPISIAGIGTVEVTAAFLFSKVGVEQSVVVSAYLFLRIVQFFLAFMTLGFFRSLRRAQ